MLVGEVVEGSVHKIMKHGVFLRCGLAEKIYLSQPMMEDYKYVPAGEHGNENPYFINAKSSAKIEKGAVLRFLVIGVRFMENEKDLQAIVSLNGADHLGPISHSQKGKRGTLFSCL